MVGVTMPSEFISCDCVWMQSSRAVVKIGLQRRHWRGAHGASSMKLGSQTILASGNRTHCDYALALCLLVVSLFCHGALAQDYTLGAGDVVKIQVYEQPDLTTAMPITQRGTVRFWLLGDVAVAGLTPGQAEEKLASLLEKGGYIKDPQVFVMVEEYRSQQVAVLGWVNKPGKYPIEGTSSIVDILAQAGGLKDDAGDVITIIRQSGGQSTKTPVDIGLLYVGDLVQNRKLDPSDLIVVPRMDVFYIYGQVKSPGQYRLARDMTLMQALSLGGGLTPRGTEKGVRVTRRGKGGSVEELTVGLTDYLQPNDVLYVKESLF